MTFKRAIARGFNEGLLVATIGNDELRLQTARHNVLGNLRRIRLRGAAEVDDISARLLHLGDDALVVRSLGVDTFDADNFEADLLRVCFEDARDALAVHLAVIEDKHFGPADFLREISTDGALDIVGWDHAKVTHLAARAIDRRLVRFTKASLRERWCSVGGAHHHEVNFVEQRHRNLRGARIKCPDVCEHRRVVDRLVSIGCFDRGIPIAALRAGVIPVFVDDFLRADLATDFTDGHLDAVDHACGLRVGAACARKA